MSFYLSFLKIFSHSTDAIKEDESLGRLVNDDQRDPNCKVKTIAVKEKNSCLFGNQDISPEEDIAYNYGDSSWPWQSMVSMFFSP